MRAVIQRRYGSAALEVREVDRPTPGPGEVLVRVRASSVHPDVWHVVHGRPWVLRVTGGGFRRPKNPIPGTDMAGVVEAVGPGATRFRPGDAVFGETVTFQWTHGGAWAEYVVVAEELLVRKPGSVTFEEAASVPTAGYIALFNIRDDPRMAPGRRVLVNGAGGGVGTIALQLAKVRGAHVTGVDSAGKLELMRRLGADEVVDYRAEDFTRRGERYHLVIDIPGNRPWSELRPALEPDGRYIPIGHEHYGASGHRVFGLIPHFLGLMARARLSGQLSARGLTEPTRSDAMAMLAELLESGRLTPVIDSTYPLERAGDALRHLAEDETLGKVILVP